MSRYSSRLSRYEIIGYTLIAGGIIVLVWGTLRFDLLHEIYAGPGVRKFGILGEYGEFIGGIVGSLWALAGVFLFFATLTYQKREFELQRNELQKTQKIFQQQNFSTLYISFVDKHNNIIDTLTAHDINEATWKGRNFFVFFQEKVFTSFVQKGRSLAPEQRTEADLLNIFQDYFTYHFSFYQSSLDPYLKNLSVLFRLIERYRNDTQDSGEYYSFITKASFTQGELFLIYHVVEFKLVEEFSSFNDPFQVFDDLAEEYKVQNIVQLVART